MIRTVASALLWLVAMAAVGFTLPTGWIAVNVADEEGYVALTAPFAEDEELQDALRSGVTDEVAAVTDVPLGQQLLRELVDGAFTALVQDPDFPQAWEDSQRASHRATFDAQAGEAERRIVVDVGPLVELVADRVSDELPVTLQVPEEVVLPVTREVGADTVAAVQDAPSQALLGAAVALAATAGSLLFARRRATALGWWGLGVAAVGGSLMLATSRGVPALLSGQASENELATTMRDLLVARATASFDEWLLVTVAVGGVVTLVGFGVRILTR